VVVSFKANDGLVDSAVQTLTITLTGVNDAPTVVAALLNPSTLQDQPFSFVVPANTFADVDSADIQRLSATLADNTPLPSWLNFDPVSRTFSGVPANRDVGVVTVKFTATDSMGATVSTNFDLTVIAVAPPAPPVVAPPVESNTAPSNTAAVMLSPVDPTVAITAPGTAAGVGSPVTPGAEVASGTGLPFPRTSDPATEPRTVLTTSSDSLTGSASTTDTVPAELTSQGSGAMQVAVIPADKPDLFVFKGVPDQSVDSGTAINFVVPSDAFAHTDAAAVVRLKATVVGDRSGSEHSLPSWLRFDPISGQFSGEPPKNSDASITIRVVARDAEGREIATVFHIKLGENGAIPEKVVVKPQSEFDGSDPHAKRLAKARFMSVGRSSLSEQIRLANRHPAASERIAAPCRVG
jgi:hypothetical protein